LVCYLKVPLLGSFHYLFHHALSLLYVRVEIWSSIAVS
jgi:hypothetical protein